MRGGHVVEIPISGLVPLVKVDLLFSGQAGNGAVVNHAGDEAGRRIDERALRFPRHSGGADQLVREGWRGFRFARSAVACSA